MWTILKIVSISSEHVMGCSDSTKIGEVVTVDTMTQAKNLLTHVSSLSFHLEPPKVFFTLYNTKEVHKVIRYNFS
jgi:hypothetical protein